VVDVGVGDEDLLELEAECVEAASDAVDVVAGVDDDGFASFLVAQDGAVALKRADGEGFEDHEFILCRRTEQKGRSWGELYEVVKQELSLLARLTRS